MSPCPPRALRRIQRENRFEVKNQTSSAQPAKTAGYTAKLYKSGTGFLGCSLPENGALSFVPPIPLARALKARLGITTDISNIGINGNRDLWRSTSRRRRLTYTLKKTA